MPWLERQGCVIAIALIGMGESDKPDIGYTFAEHSEYVDGLIEALELENITLVIHDWGSGLGFDYARRNLENVKGIAFMEASVMEASVVPAMPASFETKPPSLAEFFQAMRAEGVGEEMMAEGLSNPEIADRLIISNRGYCHRYCGRWSVTEYQPPAAALGCAIIWFGRELEFNEYCLCCSRK